MYICIAELGFMETFFKTEENVKKTHLNTVILKYSDFTVLLKALKYTLNIADQKNF